MKTLAKLALGGLMLAGTAAATAAPANAGVAVGVNVGLPGVAVAYGYGNPCYQPYWNRPFYCGYRFYGAPVEYRYYDGGRFGWTHDGFFRDRDGYRGDWQNHEVYDRGWHQRDSFDRNSYGYDRHDDDGFDRR